MAEVADGLAAAGAVGAAEAEARRIAAAARRALAVLAPSPYRAALEHLADWAVHRDR